MSKYFIPQIVAILFLMLQTMKSENIPKQGVYINEATGEFDSCHHICTDPRYRVTCETARKRQQCQEIYFSTRTTFVAIIFSVVTSVFFLFCFLYMMIDLRLQKKSAQTKGIYSYIAEKCRRPSTAESIERSFEDKSVGSSPLEKDQLLENPNGNSIRPVSFTNDFYHPQET